jgi:hypothetical protein
MKQKPRQCWQGFCFKSEYEIAGAFYPRCTAAAAQGVATPRIPKASSGRLALGSLRVNA